MKTHKYLGRNIFPCSYQSNTSKGYRWYVEAVHSSGTPYDEQNCPAFRSLNAARAFIRESRNR